MYSCQKQYWGQDEACIRMNIPGNETGGVSFAECKLTCGSDLQIWPKINGHFNKTKVARYCHLLAVKITQTVSNFHLRCSHWKISIKKSI